MKAARKKTKIQLFLEQLKDPLIYILLIAAAVSVFLGELSDATIIGTVVVAQCPGWACCRREKPEGTGKCLKKADQSTDHCDQGRYSLGSFRRRNRLTGDLVDLEAGAQVPADILLTRISPTMQSIIHRIPCLL